jgi:hypothetical protein
VKGGEKTHGASFLNCWVGMFPASAHSLAENKSALFPAGEVTLCNYG